MKVAIDGPAGSGKSTVAREVAVDFAPSPTGTRTLLDGEDVSEEDAQAAGARFQTVCPNAEISVLPGGQPVYYYIISFE